MILYFIFILIAISPVSLNEDKIDYPSFRSSVITNGKPILRGGGPEPEEENGQTSTVSNDTENKEPAISLARPKIDEENNSNLDQTELSQVNSNTTENRSKMVDDVTTLINWLIEKYNYKIVSPSARRENTDDLTSTGKGVLRSHSNRNKKKSKSRSSKKNKHTSSQKKKKLDFSNGHFRSRSKDDKHLSKKLSRITLPNDQYRGLIRNRRLMATPEEVQAEAFRIRKALRKQKLRTRKVQNQFKQGERQRMEMYGHEEDSTPQRRANSLDKPKRMSAHVKLFSDGFKKFITPNLVMTFGGLNLKQAPRSYWNKTKHWIKYNESYPEKTVYFTNKARDLSNSKSNESDYEE